MKKPQTIFYFDESGFKTELEKNRLIEQRANEVYEALKRCEVENVSIKTGGDLEDLCRGPKPWLKRHIVNNLDTAQALNIGIPLSKEKLMDLIELPDISPLVNVINNLNDRVGSFFYEDFCLLAFEHGRFVHSYTTENIRSNYTIEAIDEEEIAAKEALKDLYQAVEKINKVVHTQHLSLQDLIVFDDAGKPCYPKEYFWQQKHQQIRQRRQQKRK